MLSILNGNKYSSIFGLAARISEFQIFTLSFCLIYLVFISMCSRMWTIKTLIQIHWLSNDRNFMAGTIKYPDNHKLILFLWKFTNSSPYFAQSTFKLKRCPIITPITILEFGFYNIIYDTPSYLLVNNVKVKIR